MTDGMRWTQRSWPAAFSTIRRLFLRNYIQYGSPGYGTEEDFAPVELFGRVYGKYFEELGASIYFYVISADREVLNDCDENILQKKRDIHVNKYYISSLMG